MFSLRFKLKLIVEITKNSNKPGSRLLFHKKKFSKTATLLTDTQEENKQKTLTGSASSKYDVFSDENSPVIFDIEREREKFHVVNNESIQERERMCFAGIRPERGTQGVIDIEELIALLQKENALDIFTVKVPESLSYVDYIVIVSGKSTRHMTAIAEFVRRVYKFKTKSLTIIPDIEGENSNDWKALDLGNIALHIMSKSAREYYDLETLWTVSKEYDSQSISKDSPSIYDYSSILSTLIPAVQK